MRAAARLGAMGIALIAILVTAPGAFGQAAGGQYDPSVDPGGIVQDSAGIGSGGEGNGEENNSGGTDLPFTGYPLTPLAAIVGLLLVAGLAVRLIAPFDSRNRP